MNLHKQILEDLTLSGKRVIIRADFNVPLDDSLQITDDTRIRSTLPTINHVVDEGAKVILCSHLGRPNGKFDPKFSLAPIAKRLQRLLGKEVIFAPDCIGPAVESLVARMKPGDVMLLENLRFHAEEEKNDDAFSKSLASLADVYINDAFGAAHRAHASTVGVTKFIKEAAAGYLLKKEIEYLEGAVANPVRPFVAILGGAKVSGKIGVIENLGKKVDKVIIGGGMAFTFLKAMGLEIGKSLVENDMLDFAKGIQDHAFAKRCEILSSSRLRGRRRPGTRSRDDDRAGAGDSQGLVRLGHRTRLSQALFRGRAERQDHPVERSDGHVRGRCLRARHTGHGPCRRQCLCVEYRGRRRNGACRSPRRRIRKYFLHFDRWRCRVGASRRQNASRFGGASQSYSLTLSSPVFNPYEPRSR